MAFDGYGMPAVDFGFVNQAVNSYDKSRLGAARERVLSDLGKGTLDYGKASQALLAAGDTEGGLSLARLAEARGDRAENRALRREEFGFRQQEAERAQRNADRSFEFQRSQATEKPQIVWQDDGNGGKVPYLQDPRNPDAIKRLQPQGDPTASGGNPFGSGKFNAEQGKAAGFTDRMLQSEAILSDSLVDGKVRPGKDSVTGDIRQRAIAGVPLVGNYLVTQDYQSAEQAKRDFINAQLRRESGAAISPSEFDSANKQYFPMPGDSPETIKQKRANRRAAVEAMGREGGQAYRPKSVYDAEGRIAPVASPPKSGTVKDGYRYMGGDPASPNSWKKI